MKELTEARSLLSTAKNAWLPLWSHSHYDTHVQPLIKVYNEACSSTPSFLVLLPTFSKGTRSQGNMFTSNAQ
jgi:hypothetical protein